MLALILYTIQIWMRIQQLIKVGILNRTCRNSSRGYYFGKCGNWYLHIYKFRKKNHSKIFLNFFLGSLAESSCLTDYIIIEGSASTCDLTDTNNRYCGERFADSNGVLEHLEICGM